MTNLMQHASRLALIATLSATPFALAAQDDAVKPVDEGTNAEVSAEAEATAPVEESAEAPMTDDAAASDTAEAPVEGDMATDTAEAPMTDDTATDGMAATDTADAPITDEAVNGDAVAEAPAEEVAKPVEGQIAMQSENTILADDLIGSNVYSDAGEKVGEIDDLIVNLDGKIDGIVIGVGGFLGLGEKWVALEMASLSTATDESGTLRLVTSATKVDLEAAEPFLTANDMAAAKQSLETMPPEDPAAAPVEGTETTPSN